MPLAPTAGLLHRSRPWPGRVLLPAAVLMALVLPAGSLANARGEIEVKAAFIFNFARYLSWPTEAFSSVDSPIVIGVMGDRKFFEAAHAGITSKKVHDRLITVREFDDAPEAEGVHILFVGRSLGAMQTRIQSALGKQPVFMISDSDGFAEAGGMANFYLDDHKVRFAVNPGVAQATGLTISSKLLRIAKIVE